MTGLAILYLAIPTSEQRRGEAVLGRADPAALRCGRGSRGMFGLAAKRERADVQLAAG